MKKNPHDENSPEWQLWEQWNSADALVRAADEDAKRAEKRRSEAITRKASYAKALAKLGSPIGTE